MAAYLSRVQLSAAGFYKTPELEWDWNVRKGRPFFYYAYGAAVTEVEVDGATGMCKVRRVDILHDVGDSLNAGIDRGQIEGGFVQGMGWLTREDLKWDDKGKLLSHSASTYAIPAFSDAPVGFPSRPSEGRAAGRDDPRKQGRRGTAAHARHIRPRGDPGCGRIAFGKKDDFLPAQPVLRRKR